MIETRIDKQNYYLDIAETVAARSTCLRRIWGAVIINHDELISSGYNGAPRGRKNCTDLQYCMREKLNIPRGERYEMCRSVHAEQNAIISAARKDCLGATIYLVGMDAKTHEYVENPMPCMFCKRFILNAGISRVVVRHSKDQYLIIDVKDWIEDDDSLKGEFGY